MIYDKILCINTGGFLTREETWWEVPFGVQDPFQTNFNLTGNLNEEKCAIIKKEMIRGLELCERETPISILCSGVDPKNIDSQTLQQPTIL